MYINIGVNSGSEKLYTKKHCNFRSTNYNSILVCFVGLCLYFLYELVRSASVLDGLGVWG